MRLRENLNWAERAVRQTWAFTIVEALVAMVIVGVCVGALLSGITSATYSVQAARENQRATQVMLEKVETLRLYTWEQINTTNFIPFYFSARYDPQATNAEGLTYYGYMWLDNVTFSTSYKNELKQVAVLLYWFSGNRLKSRYLTTLVTQNGLQNYVYGPIY